MSETAALAQRIADWIGARVREAGARGVVLGLSGGIDSAVAAALCRRALGDAVVGLVLPCHSEPGDLEDAGLTAAALGLRIETWDLAAAYDALAAVLPSGERMAMANIKPRLRMTALYHYAGINCCLVCGTSNRSEIMVGYSTKWGDGAADMQPLAGLLKTRVRALAEELGVPRSVIDKPPTAGLWPGQTDEGEMGLTYEELDAVLADPDRPGVAPREKVERALGLIRASEHKRRPIPAFEP